MKFVLLVEGASEKKGIASFLKQYLDSQLSQPVGIQVVDMGGYGDFKKKAHRKAEMHINRPDRDQIIAVVGLLDLYGPQFSDFYPSDQTSTQQRYEWGVNYFEREVNNPRFRMFFAVHEFEAWIFSQPEVLPRLDRDLLPQGLRPPEEINFDRPPSNLLGELYRRAFRNRGYKKVTDGPEMFSRLNPMTAYNRCPNLKQMLDGMLALARETG
jgi:uncharacterized protein DUF4276